MKKLVASETVIIMALPYESQGLFEKKGIEVHYSGIGKINAAFKATELLTSGQIKHVLNLGTAGSHQFPAHQLVECLSFVQRDMDLTKVGVPLGKTPGDSLAGMIQVDAITNLPKGVCGTGDCVELGTPKLDCDLMDMEAYALAKVCRKLNVNFNSIKYITDQSDANTRDDWKANVLMASQELLKIYCELIG
jgi:adenosylhomocysteine nucleosidase